jgi:PAS domain S-box-containing protein
MTIAPVKVLLVDDDRSFYLIVRALLSRSRMQCEVEWAENFETARELIAENRHDVCLVDYGLKDHTGVELLRFAHERDAHMPMIMLTGYADREIDLEAMSAGAADYLLKGKMDAPLLERSIRYALERKRAEGALKRSEEHFRLLIENIQDIIAVIGSDGTIRYQSPSIEPILGYTVEEMMNRNLFDLIHPGDLPIIADFLGDRLDEPGSTSSGIYRFRHKDGSWRYMESTGKNLLDHPLIEGIVINSRDITDRKEAEDAIRESQERFDSFMGNSPALAFIKDSRGRYVYANAPYARMFDLPDGKLAGRTDDEQWPK